MAIIEDLGFSLTVCVDGTPVTEYDDPDDQADEDVDDASTTVHNKYIEIVEDSEFSVVMEGTKQHPWTENLLTKQNSHHRLSFELFVDGHKIVGRVSRTAHDFHFQVDGKEYRGKNSSQIYLAKFKFASVTTVDDSAKKRVEKDKKATKSLGLIQMKVWRKLYAGPGTSTLSGMVKTDRTLSVAEKALKGRAISHGTVFSKGVPTVDSTYVSTTHVDANPIAVINLRYRSREALRQECIIPRSPSPSEDESEDGFDNVSEEELRRLARERWEQVNARNGVKGESPRGIKREADTAYDLTEDGVEARPFKIAKRKSRAAVVDLTDD